MRIAQFCPYDIDRPGGVQRHILDLSGSLARSGHDVTIIAPQVSSRLPQPGAAVQHPVPVVKIGKGRLIAINKTAFEISFAAGSEWRKLNHLMRKARFDVVHFHTPLTPIMPLQALVQSTAANVATFHAVPPDISSGSLQRWLNRSFNRLAGIWLDELILASDVQKDIGLRGAVLPPCTNLGPFQGAASREAFAGESVNILFLGRLEERKGAMVLLKAYAALRQKGLAIRLHIAGDGPQRDVLTRYVSAENIPDVIFLGRIDQNEVPRLYASCDIFCAPSLYAEGFGIILVEAMATGKPVVAAANAGYRTVLQGEAAQFLVRPGNAADLSDKLERLISQPGLRQRLGEWGRREAVRYDSDQMVSDFLAVYNRAVQSQARRR